MGQGRSLLNVLRDGFERKRLPSTVSITTRIVLAPAFALKGTDMITRRLALWSIACIVVTAGSPVIHAQQAATTIQDLRPTRPECEMLLPERDEPNDLAKLIRADQFVRCERDGFRRDLAPPWKTGTEAHNKLVDACDYFASVSDKYFSRVGPDALQAAHDRCITRLLTLSMTGLEHSR